MDPISGAVMAGIGATYQIIQGVSQQRKARRTEQELNQLMDRRPEYSRPQEANAAMALAVARAGSRTMPGEREMQEQTQLAMANTAQAAMRSGDGQAAVLGAQGQAEAARRQIGAQRVAYQQQQQDLLTQQLMTSAGFRDQEWQMNEYAPYVDAVTRVSGNLRDQRQAGAYNVSQGLNAMSTVGLGLLTNKTSGAGQTSTGLDQQMLADYNARYPAVANRFSPKPE